jgi:hypothetical protein
MPLGRAWPLIPLGVPLGFAMLGTILSPAKAVNEQDEQEQY